MFKHFLEILTFFIDAGRLGTLDALRVNASESSWIDGDAGVALALDVDRVVLANDFAAKLERPAFVGHFDDLGLIAARGVAVDHDARVLTFYARVELAEPLLHARFYHRLQQRVLKSWDHHQKINILQMIKVFDIFDKFVIFFSYYNEQWRNISKCLTCIVGVGAHESLRWDLAAKSLSCAGHMEIPGAGRPYCASWMETAVPSGHLKVNVSPSQAARWIVLKVPDNRALKSEGGEREREPTKEKKLLDCISSSCLSASRDIYFISSSHF